jgi:hypothetical protein
MPHFFTGNIGTLIDSIFNNIGGNYVVKTSATPELLFS